VTWPPRTTRGCSRGWVRSRWRSWTRRPRAVGSSRCSPARAARWWRRHV